VREDAPFDKICYIGCGVTTGIGAVAFTMKVEPGATVAVFGLGGIGLNVIQGARMVGAARIIGVDISTRREALGRQFGMTDFVNPKDVDDVVGHLVESPAAASTTASSASATSTSCARPSSAATRAGARAASSALPARPGNLDPPVPAGHRPQLARHRLRRRPGPHGRAEDRRLVHGRARSISMT
jgi:Zn-dependent alcohol dehydrogenase